MHYIAFQLSATNHVQNDLHWEECAEQVLAFVNQL
jgi:hypothetical protein